MYLKKYQQRVVSEIKQFFITALAKKNEFATILQAIPDIHTTTNSANRHLKS